MSDIEGHQAPHHHHNVPHNTLAQGVLYIRNLRVVHSAMLCSVVVQFMCIIQHLSHQRTNTHTRARARALTYITYTACM